MRKKVFLTLSVIFMLGTGVTAQPTPTGNPSSVGISNSGIRRVTSNQPGGEVQSPLTPATLLLIAMAGGYAGVRLYHNSKNNTKE
ncbi:MAG: hypothetical protein MSS40_06815 [Bacteroidales bacterium]|nr:hypothetical protein [Bacteroidales bacterium]